VIESLRRRAGRFGLDIVLVNIWEGGVHLDEAAAYRERWGIEGTLLIDDTAAYARALGVRGVPTNVLIDDAGRVQAVGVSSADELLRAAERLEPRLRETGRDTEHPADAAPTPRDFVI